jgi:peroxiredoxin
LQLARYRLDSSERDNGRVTPLSTLDWRLRYAITAAIVLVIAGIFVQREFLDGGAGSAAGDTASSGFGPVDAAAAEVGAPAPDFVLQTIDGGTARLSDFRGKTIVLNFWASWCTPCRREMSEFQEMYQTREAAGDFVVLAVDYRPLDSASEVRRFFDDFAAQEGGRAGFPVVYDTNDGAVAERYGVAPRNAKQATLPVSFFIDRNGVLREKVFGPVFGDLLPEKVAETEAAAAG